MNRDGGQYSRQGGKQPGANKTEEGIDVFCAPSCKKNGCYLLKGVRLTSIVGLGCPLNCNYLG